MSARDIRERLERHGLAARRELGQNFLVDRIALENIAQTAARGGEPVVVEIGPGLGALTEALAATGRRIVAVERDAGLVRVLREEFANLSNVTIVEGDAREVDFASLAGEARPAVAGNLPYSVTTPILLALLAQRDRIGRTTIMVQRELADRLLARPGTKAYGSLTVLLSLHADVERIRDVGASSFWPRPKVTSTVLLVRWLPAPRVPVADPAAFERVLRAAFGQRRKTLRNSLSSQYGREHVAGAEARLGTALDFGRRAETLTLSELATLAAAVEPPA